MTEQEITDLSLVVEERIWSRQNIEGSAPGLEKAVDALSKICKAVDALRAENDALRAEVAERDRHATETREALTEALRLLHRPTAQAPEAQAPATQPIDQVDVGQVWRSCWNGQLFQVKAVTKIGNAPYAQLISLQYIGAQGAIGLINVYICTLLCEFKRVSDPEDEE